MTRRYYAVLAKVSPGYPPLKGRLVTCYSPVRHFTHGLLHFLVRLACVRHAASVDSEPGSNSRLKPDVCRRVVGRLPSPRLEKPGMAPPLRSLPSCGRSETTVVYLVRSSRAYARIRSLTTGTFNRVVKDRSTIRLSGAHSVQADTHKCESDCPRNLTNIRCGAKPCQPIDPTGFPDDFHIGKAYGAGLGSKQPQKQVPHRAFSPVRNDNAFGWSSLQRATVSPSALFAKTPDFGACLFSHDKAED